MVRNSLNVPIIRALIFDLDDTLFDTYGQLVRPASREACQAMIDAGLNATFDEAVKVREELFAANPRANVYQQLVAHLGVKPPAKANDVVQAGFDAFHDRKIKEKITLFPDAESTLKDLGLKYELFLVTLGAPSTQKKKIEALQLKELFGDKISLVDISREKTKSGAFKKIISKTGLAPETCVSIGNRMDLEIREGKELGMQTILMLHGEYVRLKPQNPMEEADAQISQLGQLKELLL